MAWTLTFVLTVCLLIFFALSGVSALPFFAFALFKAAYTPLAAYAVARWVILRRLSALSALPR